MKNKYVNRKLDIKSVLEEKSCFLFGPRQSGKSSLVAHTLEDVHHFDLLSGSTFMRLSSNPAYIEETCTDGKPVVIDEIQKLTARLDEVHRLIEATGLTFLLTGSSARKLRRQGVNLLGGRARVRKLHPFSASELGDDFDLDRALNYGLVPGIWFGKNPDEDLSDYINEYLQQEIMAEGATRNLPAYSRFLEVAALCSGEQIDYSGISRDAKVPRTTVQEYFRILDETMLACEVPVWKGGKGRKTVETSKFYMFDTGVARRLTGRNAMTAGTAEYGHAFEGWIHHELRSYLDFRRRDGVIAYWRTQSGTEVDFVVDDVAIEAKCKTEVGNDDLKGLKAIAGEGPFRARIVVSREPVPRCRDGIEILPWKDFIDRLWNGEIVK